MPTLLTNFNSTLRVFLMSLIMALALAACGGSGAGGGGGGGTGGGGGGGGGGGNPTPTPLPSSMSISLVDATTGSATSAISSSNPGVAKVRVLTGSGAPLPNVVVTFKTDTALVTMSPSSGTALTDANGNASVTVAPANVTAAGATTISAAAQVGVGEDAVVVTGSVAFAIGATNVTLSPITLGSGVEPLSAFGSTSVSVTVLANGAAYISPLSVSFSSGCAASGKAVITPTVTTANGIAIASYLDKGCSGPDTITASLSGITATTSVVLQVSTPKTGSIQFVSAKPSQITLKGTGGGGLSESAEVRFKVLDEAGNPVGGKRVTFDLSTTVGGLSLTSAFGISDAITGDAVTNVISGSVSTPVRVLAQTITAAGVILKTQSDALTITTGVPTQSAFSVGAITQNIEGLKYDGTNTLITARLADHFGNPPPAGTVVNFISEGAKVAGSCTTSTAGATAESGVCSVLLTSQALRPKNGRVSVLAYAVGEESFVDLNGNGVVDSASELVDPNGLTTVGAGEAFVDFNESGIKEANEPFVDFNGDNVSQSTSDGKYKGVLCDQASGLCSASKTLHIRRSVEVVLSGSNPVMTYEINSSQAGLIPNFDVTACGSVVNTLNLTIADVNGNPMPAGTTVSLSPSTGHVVSQSGWATVPSTTQCMKAADTYSLPLTSVPAAYGEGCPETARTGRSGDLNYSLTLDGDSFSGLGTCPVKSGLGSLVIRVATPGGGGNPGTVTEIPIGITVR